MAAAEEVGTGKPALYEAIGRERVAYVVDDFYARVRKHPALAEPFAVVADWDEHKARMTHYWWRSLGGPRYRPYRYEVMARHEPVEVSQDLLKAWLALFAQTLREDLPDDLARPWYERARRIAGSLRVLAERRNAGQGTAGSAERL